MKKFTLLKIMVGLVILVLFCSLQSFGFTRYSVKTGYIDVGGTKLYYEELGQGKPLILLHGGFLNCRMWDSQFTEFAKKYRVIRFDARGHGQSKNVTGTYSNYDDLKMVMQKLKIKKAAIMGLSLGGRTAIDFAIKYPQMTAVLILAAPGASGYDFSKEKHTAEYFNKYSEAAKTGDLEKIVEAFIQGWTDGPFRKPGQVDPEVRSRIKEMALNTGRNFDPKVKAKLTELGAINRLSEIKAPTLAIVGSLDMPSITEIVDKVKTDVQGAEKVVIEGAAHMINMEKPAEFNRIVTDFLKLKKY